MRPTHETDGTELLFDDSAGLQGAGAGEFGSVSGAEQEHTERIRMIGPSGTEVLSFDEEELIEAFQEQGDIGMDRPWAETHIYSTINNWPTARYYAAQGYRIESILSLVDLYSTAMTVTFRSGDGYEISLTREQLMSPQYYYPHVGQDGDGAVPVYPILAYRWREGSEDRSSIREDRPCLIFGQTTPFEHTNPAFVLGVSEIIVSDTPCEAWSEASTFPLPGVLYPDETVKLQHPDYGLVKLHYTLDGSEPSIWSPMYNPSTFQPELNKPIPIEGPTTINVMVYGYGKRNSAVSTFTFSLADQAGLAD